jgi:hypothetical protein
MYAIFITYSYCVTNAMNAFFGIFFVFGNLRVLSSVRNILPTNSLFKLFMKIRVNLNACCLNLLLINALVEVLENRMVNYISGL